VGRPSKSVNTLTGHRTKAEKELREKAEKNLKTGKKLKEFDETKKDVVAHKEYLRVSKLLAANDKDDDMYSAVVNRYCILCSECRVYELLIESYNSAIIELSEDKEKIVEDYLPADRKSEGISLAQYYKLKSNFSKTLTSLDEMIMKKRKMMFDIEKENLMTVASGLRSIPKKPDSEPENPLKKLLIGNG